ncbi:hypothetical protein GSU45_07950 [Rathayibacter sp. VKM Ac-2801]|nr:hypothetical protein GSU45_07950 [Rathayibacter sp. VKM Ac-2801]
MCSDRCRQRRSRANRSAARDAALALLERRDCLAAAGGTAEQVAALDDRARALLRAS